MMRPTRLAFFSLVLAGGLRAQEAELARVRSESARLRQMPAAKEDDFSKNLQAIRKNTAALHTAIRDWVWSLLPKSRAALDAESQFLQVRLGAELQRWGLIGSITLDDDFKPGFVSDIKISRPAEDPDKVVVTAGVVVPCGEDDAVYVYDYSRGEPRRILETASPEQGETIFDVRFSRRDAGGNQLIITLRYGVQCGSSWNTLSYDVFHFSSTASAALPVLAGKQGIFFGNDNAYSIRAAPDELLMEVWDRSIDIAHHSRAHVLHFRLNGSWMVRIDPVALQPHDFVDEWLTRPWAEMASRSAQADLRTLKKWHELLSGDYVSGDITLVQQCREHDQWQIRVGLGWIGGKKAPETLTTYFLVRQTDRYRFEMLNVSFVRQEGCPGKSSPPGDRPTLFPETDKH